MFDKRITEEMGVITGEASDWATAQLSYFKCHEQTCFLTKDCPWKHLSGETNVSF